MLGRINQGFQRRDDFVTRNVPSPVQVVGREPPPTQVTMSRERRKPKGIVHFIPGFALSGTPYLGYRWLANDLCRADYTVVQTPYVASLNHEALAEYLSQSYSACIENLRKDPDLEYAAPEDALVHGVGHSNGAHLHLLMGATAEARYRSNVLLCYNNKKLDEILSFPGAGFALKKFAEWFDGKGYTKDQVKSGADRIAAEFPQLKDLVGIETDELSEMLTVLGVNLREVAGGGFEFIPSPEEARKVIQDNYTVPDTLMIRFKDDDLDQTPEMVKRLKNDDRRSVQEKVLDGDHETPCFGPAVPNTLVGAASTAASVGGGKMLNKVKTTDAVWEWLDAHSDTA